MLSVRDAASIDGTLDLLVVNNSELVAMESFLTLSAASLTGTFETINGRSTPNNLEFFPVYNPTNFTLDVSLPLRLASKIGDGGNAIDLDDIGMLRQAAISLWVDAGISQDLAATREQVQFRVVDLSGDLLGLANGNVILLDADAAGLGWFVDNSPETNDDLQEGQVDLLTAIAHELGRTLGLSDNLDPLANDIMAARLAAAQQPATSMRSGRATLANKQPKRLRVRLVANRGRMTPGPANHRTATYTDPPTNHSTQAAPTFPCVARTSPIRSAGLRTAIPGRFITCV